MNSDSKGCSTTKTGQEQYECFTSKINRKKYFQYDYRAANGELFSACAPTLNKCRELRDKWLEREN